MSKAALLSHVAAQSIKSDIPAIKVGQTIRVHQKIKEGDKERIQVFEGLIIAMNNGTGVNGTFTVRKVVDSIGVEKTFPRHSAFIAKIELVKQAKVRRAKLYHMRGLTGKAARMKETWFESDETIAKRAAKAEKTAEKATQQDA